MSHLGHVLQFAEAAPQPEKMRGYRVYEGRAIEVTRNRKQLLAASLARGFSQHLETYG